MYTYDALGTEKKVFMNMEYTAKRVDYNERDIK